MINKNSRQIITLLVVANIEADKAGGVVLYSMLVDLDMGAAILAATVVGGGRANDGL